MFRSKPIIRDESIGAGSQRNLADEVPIRLGGPPGEPAAMHVKDRSPFSCLCRLGPPAGYPSDCSGFEGHSLRGCDSLHDVVERAAASGSFDFAFHGCDRRSQSCHRGGIFLAERMYKRPGGFRRWVLEDVRLHFYFPPKAHFAKGGIGAEKGVTRCPQEWRAFPNHSTRSSARSSAWCLRP